MKNIYFRATIISFVLVLSFLISILTIRLLVGIANADIIYPAYEGNQTGASVRHSENINKIKRISTTSTV